MNICARDPITDSTIKPFIDPEKKEEDNKNVGDVDPEKEEIGFSNPIEGTDNTMDQDNKKDNNNVNYFSKYIEEKCIRIENAANRIAETVKDLKSELKMEVNEIKRNNKDTRRCIIVTGIALVTACVTILIAFTKVHDSWVQTALSNIIKLMK